MRSEKNKILPAKFVIADNILLFRALSGHKKPQRPIDSRGKSTTLYVVILIDFLSIFTDITGHATSVQSNIQYSLI